MFHPVSEVLALGQRTMQRVAVAALVVLALALIGLTLAMAFGRLPWPEIAVSFAGAPMENAGMGAMIALTLFAAMLLFFLPGNARMMRLEKSHRDFALTMEDIARAYRVAHEADRKKLFRIGSEFDSVRERMEHLRSHPDLGALEPEILDLAARMSFQTRELARTYSDDNVTRARGFLSQRQEEIERFTEKLETAKTTCAELRHWLLQIETEETVAKSQLEALEKDLLDLLPQIGFELGFEERPVGDATVVSMADKAPRPGKAERR